MACFKELRDEEYCRGVVEATAELAETRRVAYRGRRGITHVLNLPRGDQPYVQIAVDYKQKKGLVVALVGEGYMIFLMYRRDEDKFRPVHAEVINAEIAAAANHNLPTGALHTLLNRTQTS
ncbi:MAG: hypothetical protein ACO2PM_18815 [Pyrobaculum sp.]